MKYCTRCGAELNENFKFCTKCGSPTINELNRRKEEKEKIQREKNDKFVLQLGIALIIISSFIIFVLNYNEMNNFFRMLFLVSEMIIFMFISFVTKKMNSNSYKLFYLAGILFVPLIMILVPYYNFITPFFREGAGLAIYLSICSIICIIICLISNKIFKLNIYLYLTCLLSNILFITISYSINIYINKYLIFAVLILLNLIINIISLYNKNNSFTKIILNYIKIFFITSFIFIFYIICTEANISKVIISMISIFYVLLGYIQIINNKNSILSYLALLFNLIISIWFMNSLFIDYKNMKIYLTTLLVILELFISYLLNNRNLNILSYIFTFAICLYEYVYALSISYKVTLVLSLVFLALVLLIIKIEENSNYKDLLMLLLGLIMYSFIFSLIKSFANIDLIYILLLTSILYSTIYVILKTKNNSYYKIFEWLSYIFLIYSCFINLFNSDLIPSIISQIIWIYYFIFKLIFDDDIAIKNLLLTGLILNVFILSGNLNLKLYYTILLISTLLILISIISKYKYKASKYNIFYTIGLILFTVSALVFDIEKYNKIIIFTHIILYILLYIKSFYKKDIKYIYKLLYILGGLSLIYGLVNSFNLPILIESIIFLFTIIVLLVTMFLLEADKDKYILSYSLFAIIPLSDIIGSINIIRDYNSLIITGILTIYIFISIEKILKIRNSDREIIEILWLILITLSNFSISDKIIMMIFIIFSIFIISFGIRTGRQTFIYYGSIILLIICISQLIKLRSSFVIIITLLLVGVGLIIYSLVKELIKNNKS